MPDVTLRPVLQSDCTDRYVAWLNDPQVNRWLETRWEPQTRDTIERYLAKCYADKAKLMAICLDGRHIGNLRISPVHPVHLSADISYFIGERGEWGKGYATLAVRLACRMAFKDLGLHRLNAGVYSRNEASKRVLRRCGFSHEGTLRRALKIDKGWEDHWLYGRCEDAVPL